MSDEERRALKTAISAAMNRTNRNGYGILHSAVAEIFLDEITEALMRARGTGWKIISNGKELTYPNLRMASTILICVVIGMIVGHNLH